VFLWAEEFEEVQAGLSSVVDVVLPPREMAQAICQALASWAQEGRGRSIGCTRKRFDLEMSLPECPPQRSSGDYHKEITGGADLYNYA